MILEGAIGDAYGAGFEFAEREKIDSKNLVTSYEQHPLHPEIQARYTDDTQMTIALAELMLSGKAWSPVNIASAFLEAFHRDPRRGYARRFHQFLTEQQSGEAFLQNIITKSERNGAAMRAYVVGLFEDEKTVLERSEIQAMVTHGTENAISAAKAIALCGHYYWNGKGPNSEIVKYLHHWGQTKWTGIWEGEVQMSGTETVEAVLAVMLKGGGMRQRLQNSVALGGDVDTVASIVMALSSLDESCEQDLPQFLFDELENGPYGAAFLKNLDEELCKKFG